MFAPWKKNYDKPRQHIKKQRHWKRKWQPTPLFLSGKVHGQKSLEDCSSWGYITADAFMRRVEGCGLVAINW